MKRSTRHLLWLLAGVLLLVLVSAWQWRASLDTAPGHLLPLDPSAVTRIRLQRPGHPEQRYQLRGARWFRTAPGPATPVDATTMQALTALAATPVLRWRSASDLDPAQLGLDPPALTLHLNGQRLDYGKLAAFGPRRYVRVGPRVAVIPARYSPLLHVPEADSPLPAAASAPAPSRPSSQKS